MLFSIAGSQGTGKSTLIESLQTHFPSDIPKTSRSILKDWNVSLSQVNNDHKLTIEFQEEILKRKTADEAPFVADPDKIYVTERTYADLFTYALVVLGKDNEYSDWLDDYYERCKAQQEKYMAVFYLNGGFFKPVHDGVRGSNQHYSRLVDLVMWDYTDKMSACYLYPVTEPGLNSRLEFVSETVLYMQHLLQEAKGTKNNE